METLLLPGLDGTGRLLTAFASHLAPTLNPRIVSYPPDEPCTYAQLVNRVHVPAEPFAVVAESFSGPLAVLLASAYPGRIRGLVLVATFVRSPLFIARLVPSFVAPLLFRLPLPAMVMRAWLVGMDATEAEVTKVRGAVRSVSPVVLAKRLQEVASVDVRREFAEGREPVLYIGGLRDRLVGEKVAVSLKRLRPELEMRLVDAPHLVLQRRSQETARLVSEWLLPRIP